MPTISHVRRTRGPAIAWTPTDQSRQALAEIPTGTAARSPALCLTQAAILEIDAHLHDSISPAPFGLLAGALCISPQEDFVYLLIDAVAPSRIELSGSDPYTQLLSELRSLAARQARQGKLTIGWYLGGMTDDLTLDSEVKNLHRALFPEPRHVLLLRGEAAGIEHGAFLRLDSASDTTYPIPFFELLPEREIEKTSQLRTVIRWNEYHSYEQASLVYQSEAGRQSRDVASPARWETRILNASLESVRQGLRASSRAKPPAASTPLNARAQETAAERIRAQRDAEHQAQSSAPTSTTAPPFAQPPAPEAPEALAASAPSPEAGQRPPAPHVPAESPPLVHAQSSTRDIAPLERGRLRQPPTASAETNGAGGAPASSLQHIFFDGTLVPVRWTQKFNRKSRQLLTIRRESIVPLLVVALVVLVVAALYRFAR